MTVAVSTQQPTGLTVLDLRFDPATGHVYNTATKLYEAWNPANLANYKIAVPEIAVGYYRAALPVESLDVLADDVLFLDDGAGGLTPAGIGQAQGVNVAALNGDLAAAVALALSAGEIVAGAAVTGTLAPTIMSTNLTDTLTKAYVGRSLIWTSGVLKGVAVTITAYDGVLKALRFTAAPAAPSNGDGFIIV